jgi:hypothetical protein
MKKHDVKYYDNGCYEEEWTMDGQHHREEGPAAIKWRNNKIISKTWMRNDMLHREDGPAFITLCIYNIE